MSAGLIPAMLARCGTTGTNVVPTRSRAAGVAVAGSRSTIRVHTQGTNSMAISAVSARQMAMTATRCTGVKVSNGIVLDGKSCYNGNASYAFSIARLDLLAKQREQSVHDPYRSLE
jgi:hypothetical protein